MKNADSIIRKDIIFHGRVQGVGFRYYSVQGATALGLTGTVENLYDGTVHMEVQGTQEVLVKLWTYDPDITDIKKAKTFRLLMKELPLQKGRNRVAIPIDQLYTPDFWYEDVKTESGNKHTHMETAARLEIAPGWNQARGKSFSLKIHGIKAIGMSSFSFGIVLAIFVVLTIIAVGRRHQVKDETEREDEEQK